MFDHIKTKDQCKTLQDISKLYIEKVLELHDWNKTQAAETLGICTKTLANYITKWRVEDRTKTIDALADNSMDKLTPEERDRWANRSWW